MPDPEEIGDAVRHALNPKCIDWKFLQPSEKSWWTEVGQNVLDKVASGSTST